jgi:hypothetical protein
MAIGVVGTQIYVALQVRRALRELGIDSVTDIDLKEITAKTSDGHKKSRQVTCEYSNGQILLYDTETKQFLAQGENFDTATDALAERLGGGTYELKFDMDNEALARVKREIEVMK